VEEADNNLSQYSKLEKTVLVYPFIRYLLLINLLNSWRDFADYIPAGSLSGFSAGGL